MIIKNGAIANGAPLGKNKAKKWKPCLRIPIKLIKPKAQKANKKVNTLLTMGCMNFAKLKGKANIFREYYQRKVAEGKNKMAVINALRNKLVHTIFALVKKGEKFVNSLNNLQNNLVLP